jgi:predicted dinucleotide-binding enzyme
MNYYPERDGRIPELDAGELTSSALPLAGDDAPAKARVVQLPDILGYAAVDFGTLADS